MLCLDLRKISSIWLVVTHQWYLLSCGGSFLLLHYWWYWSYRYIKWWLKHLNMKYGTKSWYATILISTCIFLFYRSSHRRCSIKIGVLKNLAKFTGKHLCHSLFFNKVAGLRPKNTFFTEHLQATASVFNNFR